MEEWGKYLIRIGWTVEKVKLVGGGTSPVFIRSIPLIPFRVMKCQRFTKQIDERDWRRIKKENMVIFSALEPATDDLADDWLKKGYRWDRVPFLPAKTRIIDLTKSEENLWKNLDQNARRILSKDRGIKIRKITAEEFYDGWRKWSPAMILTGGQYKAFNKAFGKKLMYYASFEGKEIASAIMMIYSSTGAHYYQTWTSKSGRKNNGQFYLVWEMIKKTKRDKKKFFDFEGIYDERFPLKNWGGFTEFKRKFGGDVVTYPGCLQKWF